MFMFFFIRFCQLGQGGHKQHMSITVGPLPNPPCQLSLWEETEVPGENQRLWVLVALKVLAET